MKLLLDTRQPHSRLCSQSEQEAHCSIGIGKRPLIELGTLPIGQAVLLPFCPGLVALLFPQKSGNGHAGKSIASTTFYSIIFMLLRMALVLLHGFMSPMGLRGLRCPSPASLAYPVIRRVAGHSTLLAVILSSNEF